MQRVCCLYTESFINHTCGVPERWSVTDADGNEGSQFQLRFRDRSKPAFGIDSDDFDVHGFGWPRASPWAPKNTKNETTGRSGAQHRSESSQIRISRYQTIFCVRMFVSLRSDTASSKFFTRDITKSLVRSGSRSGYD